MLATKPNRNNNNNNINNTNLYINKTTNLTTHDKTILKIDKHRSENQAKKQ